MAIVELKNVEVSYGATKALRGVTCTVEGGAVGLLGPNGAGKSTLLKTLLGFIRADAGEASLFGFRLPAQALEARQRLGYMPERDAVGRKVSAVSFLTYCGCLFGMKRTDAMERAHEVLNYVGMGDSRYRKMQTYSTGMCQRIKFAQALVHDPKLLLLDEPTNGLDPEGIRWMRGFLQSLAAEGRTVLVSSHLLAEVQQTVDWVVIISRGRSVYEGSLDGLETGQVVRIDSSDRAALTNALSSAGAEVRATDDALLATGITAGEAGAAALAAGVPLSLLITESVGLEEVFLQLVGSDADSIADGIAQVSA